MTFRPSRHFNVNAGLSLLRPRFTDFSNAAVNAICTFTQSANPGVTPGSFTCPSGTGATFTTGTATNIFASGPAGGATISSNIGSSGSGNDLIRAPRRTLNVGATYIADLAGGQLEFNANAMFSAKYFSEVGNRVFQPAYEVVNGSITYRLPGNHLEFSFFGKNLTNQLYFASSTVSTVIDNVAYAKPRWFGVRAKLTY